jgi:galactokinase
MSLENQVVEAFKQRYGQAPQWLVRAPGRVNLIGEHTDYNDGFVLPMAINRAVWIALAAVDEAQVEVYSLEYNESKSFSLEGFSGPDGGDEGWLEYLRGTAWALQDAGFGLAGWKGVMAGDVPMGAGLSSSAALELATARAFAVLKGWAWDAAAMARLGQRAENQWVGVHCGIMDQMISAAGKADHALLIDCRSLETELVPLPAQTAVVVLDTGTRRGLVDSAYNERRSQCEAAAGFFGVKALRDVGWTQFEARQAELDELTRKRARHVVAENARVEAAVVAMRAGDAARLGALMDASHQSLKDDFEVSSPALDQMVECARTVDGCIGARMTGAGFGGCAMALIQEGKVVDFADQVGAAYRAQSGNEPQVYVCQATDGAGSFELSI